jgi:hypothetical protein
MVDPFGGCPSPSSPDASRPPDIQSLFQITMIQRADNTTISLYKRVSSFQSNNLDEFNYFVREK